VAQHSSLDCWNPAHRSKPQACQEAVVRTWLGRNIRYSWIVECGFATGVIEARDRYAVACWVATAASCRSRRTRGRQTFRAPSGS